MGRIIAIAIASQLLGSGEQSNSALGRAAGQAFGGGATAMDMATYSTSGYRPSNFKNGTFRGASRNAAIFYCKNGLFGPISADFVPDPSHNDDMACYHGVQS